MYNKLVILEVVFNGSSLSIGERAGEVHLDGNDKLASLAGLLGDGHSVARVGDDVTRVDGESLLNLESLAINGLNNLGETAEGLLERECDAHLEVVTVSGKGGVGLLLNDKNHILLTSVGLSIALASKGKLGAGLPARLDVNSEHLLLGLTAGSLSCDLHLLGGSLAQILQRNRHLDGYLCSLGGSGSSGHSAWHASHTAHAAAHAAWHATRTASRSARTSEEVRESSHVVLAVESSLLAEAVEDVEGVTRRETAETTCARAPRREVESLRASTASPSREATWEAACSAAWESAAAAAAAWKPTLARLGHGHAALSGSLESVLVVQFSLVLVGEDVVCFGDLLELLLVSTGLVGVELQGHLSVALFDVCLRGACLHAQRVVKFCFFHHCMFV